MRSRQVAAGDTAVLECLSSGSPRPHLSWLKDGAPLVATERHFLVADAQLLVITDSRPSDSGQYACEMTNTLGIERGLSLLQVLPGEHESENYPFSPPPPPFFFIITILTQGDEVCSCELVSRVLVLTPSAPLFPAAKTSLGGPLGGADTEGMTTGIVVIVVVVCIVGTSLVWVFIIYKTRKRQQRPNCSALPEAPPATEPAARRRDEQEPFLAAEVDAGTHVCADNGSGEPLLPHFCEDTVKLVHAIATRDCLETALYSFQCPFNEHVSARCTDLSPISFFLWECACLIKAHRKLA